MISIKVCKLSDITNRIIVLFFICIGLVILYNLSINIIDSNSMDFIKLSLRNNLAFSEKENKIKDMIFCNIPINISSAKDDIEKEFNLVENSNSIENNLNQQSANIENSKDTVIKKNYNKLIFTSPYLLECEKLSASKYKIGSVTINDYTKKNLDFGELEKSLFTELNDDFKVLIYHTHTSESYTGVDNYSDAYRTEDNSSNVVRVGEALKDELNKYGVYVRHDTTQHDYPSYNGAYKSSLNTVENILKNENYDIILDIHRDALASNTQYRPTAEINGETVAKVMFVVGTNAAGLKHDNWINNLKFAIAVQQRANEVYPGFFRDLHLSTSRYNQHTSDKTLIIEVGATGNTIEEACLSMKYLAQLLVSM